MLKKIAGEYLPRKIVHRAKRGFTVPVSKWVKNSALIREVLSQETYYGHGLVNREYVGRMLGEHTAGREDWARQLWLVFVFNYWWYGQAGEKEAAE